MRDRCAGKFSHRDAENHVVNIPVHKLWAAFVNRLHALGKLRLVNWQSQWG
jgi:hypothetical protein